MEEQAAQKQTIERVSRDLSGVDASKIELKRLPLFKDVDSGKWPVIFIAKCRACTAQIADFSETKKDAELKDDKKECLIELIDVLNEPEAAEVLLNDKILTEAFKMISANLFRTFANKSKRPHPPLTAPQTTSGPPRWTPTKTSRT